MHQVVLHVERQVHHVADRVRVLWNLDPERVLDAPDARQRVNPGAHAADTLGEGPGVPGVATLENHLETAPHRARGYGVPNDVLVVDVDLDAKVTLDPRHRIDDDALSARVEVEAIRSGSHD